MSADDLTFAEALRAYGIAVRTRWLLQSENGIPAPPVAELPDPRAEFLKGMHLRLATLTSTVAAIFADYALGDDLQRFIQGAAEKSNGNDAELVGVLTGVAVSTTLHLAHQDADRADGLKQLCEAILTEAGSYQHLVRIAQRELGVTSAAELPQLVEQYMNATLQKAQAQGIDSSTVEQWLFPFGRQGISLLLDPTAAMAYGNGRPGITTQYLVEPLIPAPANIQDSGEPPTPTSAPTDDDAFHRLELLRSHGGDVPPIAAAAWRYLEAVAGRLNAGLPEEEHILVPTPAQLKMQRLDGDAPGKDFAAHLARRLKVYDTWTNLQSVGLVGNVVAMGNATVDAVTSPALVDRPLFMALAAALPIQVAVAALTARAASKTRRQVPTADAMHVAARRELEALANLMDAVSQYQLTARNGPLHLFDPRQAGVIKSIVVAAGIPAELVNAVLSPKAIDRYREAISVLEQLPEFQSPNAAYIYFHDDGEVNSSNYFTRTVVESAGVPVARRDAHQSLAALMQAFNAVSPRSLAITAEADSPQVTALLSGVAGPYPQHVAGKIDAADGVPVLMQALDTLSKPSTLTTLVRTAEGHPSVDRALAGVPLVGVKAAVMAVEEGIGAPELDAMLSAELERDDSWGRTAKHHVHDRAHAVVGAAWTAKRSTTALLTTAEEFAELFGHEHFGAATRSHAAAFASTLPDIDAIRLAQLFHADQGVANAGSSAVNDLRAGGQWQRYHDEIAQRLADDVRALPTDARRAFGNRLRSRTANLVVPPVVTAAIDGDDPPAPGSRPTGPHQPLPRSGPGGGSHRDQDPSAVDGPGAHGPSPRSEGKRRRLGRGPARNATSTPPTPSTPDVPGSPVGTTKSEPFRRTSSHPGRLSAGVPAGRRLRSTRETRNPAGAGLPWTSNQSSASSRSEAVNHQPAVAQLSKTNRPTPTSIAAGQQSGRGRLVESGRPTSTAEHNNARPPIGRRAGGNRSHPAAGRPAISRGSVSRGSISRGSGASGPATR